RKPVPVPSAERPVPPTPGVNPPAQVALPSVIEPPPANTLAPVVVPPKSDVIDETAPPAATTQPSRRRLSVRWPIAIGATVGVIALGVLATRSRKQAPPPDSVSPVS